jgi:nucleotide-binding universal stress UspA family protein
MKILIAVEDSKFCQAAANTLIALVKANGTEIRLLHVLARFIHERPVKVGSGSFCLA